MSAPDVEIPAGAATRAVRWLSRTATPPRRIGHADDRTRADDALRRIRAGEALLYAGDYHNARQLLAALARRLSGRRGGALPPAESFRRERHRQREAHLLLNRLLVPVEPGGAVPLSRAPDVAAAVAEALGEIPGVDDVHDLHVWTVTSGFLAMSGHAVVHDPRANQHILDEAHRRMRERFGIRHATIQLECPAPVKLRGRGDRQG